jgi:hypothetical protein
VPDPTEEEDALFKQSSREPAAEGRKPGDDHGEDLRVPPEVALLPLIACRGGARPRPDGYGIS